MFLDKVWYKVNKNVLHLSSCSSIILSLLPCFTTPFFPLCLRSWRRACAWNVSATVCLDPAPPRPAGQHSPSSVSWDTSSRTSTARLCTWSRCEPVATSAQPSWRSKNSIHTASPWTQNWSTSRSRPTTVRPTLSPAVWEHRVACATKQLSNPIAATWCAAAEDITHTNTHAFGSATASSCGAVM